LPGQVGQPGSLALRPGDDFVGMNIDPRGGTAGNQLGRIHDLVIRPDGTIGYVVMEGSGAAGSSTHYPIPWSQMKYEAQPMDGTGILQGGDTKPAGKGRIIAGFEGDRMKGAPSFDAASWPRDTRAFDESERYFAGGQTGGRADSTGTPRPAGTGSGSTETGVGTAEAGARNEAHFRASKFKEQVVVDSTGNPIGKTGRIAIDPTQGRVNYVTVTLSNVPGGSGRTIAVPWSALRATRVGEENRLQLNMPADKLQNAPQFKAGTADWKEMSDPNWVRSLYGYYGVDPYWSGGANDGTQNPAGTRGTNPNDRGSPDRGSPDRGSPDKGSPDKGATDKGSTGGQTGNPDPR